MLRHFLSVFLGAALLLSASAHFERTQASDDFRKGMVLPDWTMTDIDGVSFKLSETDKPLTIVHYWASWCGPCIVEFPNIIQTMRELNDDVHMIAISLDVDAQAMNRYIDDLDADGLDIRWVHDQDFTWSAVNYSLLGIPETVFVSPQRKILKKVNDEFKWTSASGWKELTSMIAGSI